VRFIRESPFKVYNQSNHKGEVMGSCSILAVIVIGAMVAMTGKFIGASYVSYWI